MAQAFIARRKLSWQQLEHLLSYLSGFRRLRNLTRAQVRQLGNHYRRTVADLAIARVESGDQRLVSYLNSLVIRAHGLIYRSDIRSARFIWNFYWVEFPAIFRRYYRYPLSVFLLFALIAIFSFVATWHNDDFAEFAYLTPQTIQDIKAGHRWWESLNANAPVGATAIIFNNLGVAFRTFTFSLFPVLGTLYAIMPTSLQFGAINAIAIKYEMKLGLWSFVAGHGVLEFAAIFIAGGAGLLFGVSLIAPGDFTRRDALLAKGSIAIKLFVGCLPFFILAGLIEGFISPVTMPYYLRTVITLSTIVFLFYYLLRSNP